MIKFKWETGFKETPIGKIPKDWNIQPMEDITNKLPGAAFSSKYFNKEGRGLPLIRIRDLGKRTTEACYDGPYEDKYIVKSGDILIGMDGAFDVHKWKGPIGLLNQRVLKIWPKEKNRLDKDYLYYASIIPVKTFEEQVVGTTVAHLLMEHLKYIYIPLPPTKEEQKRIATVLSWFDDLIENKRRQNEILEKVAMAIFKSWFIDFEPFQDEEFIYSEELDMEIPKGWEVKPLKEVAEVIMGQSPPSKYYNYVGNGYPFIQGMGQFGKFLPITDTYSTMITKLSKPYDILITVRAPIGELNISERDYVLGRGVGAIRSRFWSFIFAYLKTFQGKLKSYERGTTFEAITKRELKSFPMLIPPKPVLEKFHSLVEPLFKKMIINEKEIMVLKKVRDTLLPQLVFGRLRVEEI